MVFLISYKLTTICFEFAADCVLKQLGRYASLDHNNIYIAADLTLVAADHAVLEYLYIVRPQYLLGESWLPSL